ncbi:MAG TPA: hypothetical protein VMI54_19050 [Polyangiaceae bacterium]|nr:hypothetical protein [Polyangiaceae bacterium]
MSLALVPALLLVAACGPSSPAPKPYVLTPDDVAAWAPNVSALAAYLSIYQPLAAYDGQATFQDPNCPVVERGESTLTITGDCTDSTGQAWWGSVSMDTTTHELTLSDFGNGADVPASKQSGTASIDDGSATSRDFTLELGKGDGSSIDYQGHVDGDYDGRTVWNGSGTFVRRDAQTNGEVTATTVDEVYDNALCTTQPASGTTELTLDAHTALVSYDGAVACSDGAAADVTIDDVPAGKITGISCSVSAKPPLGAGSVGLGVVLGVAAASGLRRRRRTRRVEEDALPKGAWV